MRPAMSPALHAPPGQDIRTHQDRRTPSWRAIICVPAINRANRPNRTLGPGGLCRQGFAEFNKGVVALYVLRGGSFEPWQRLAAPGVGAFTTFTVERNDSAPPPPLPLPPPSQLWSSHDYTALLGVPLAADNQRCCPTKCRTACAADKCRWRPAASCGSVVRDAAEWLAHALSDLRPLHCAQALRAAL
eukprot:SAG11_NODE_1511_length_4769_cov_3.389722_5_plen_188_part_00